MICNPEECKRKGIVRLKKSGGVDIPLEIQTDIKAACSYVNEVLEERRTTPFERKSHFPQSNIRVDSGKEIILVRRGEETEEVSPRGTPVHEKGKYVRSKEVLSEESPSESATSVDVEYERTPRTLGQKVADAGVFTKVAASLAILAGTYFSGCLVAKSYNGIRHVFAGSTPRGMDVSGARDYEEITFPEPKTLNFKKIFSSPKDYEEITFPEPKTLNFKKIFSSPSHTE